MKKREIKINEGHYFEVLDRAYTICEMMETIIGRHPLLEVEGELKRKYDAMIKEASEFYQLAGSLEHTITQDEKIETIEYLVCEKCNKNNRDDPEFWGCPRGGGLDCEVEVKGTIIKKLKLD
jgi:hypothetical protein